jgi:hypothetical protein
MAKNRHAIQAELALALASLGTVVAAVVRMVCAGALSQIACTLSSIDMYSA